MAKAKGIYKRGNMYWICYADPFGKIRYESSKSSAFKDAQGLLVRRKKEVQEGISPVPARQIANHPFSELAEHYKAWGVGRQRGFQTKIDHLRQLTAIFGNLPLRSFTSRMLEEWQTQRMERNKPSTVNRMLATLKHMFTKAVEWEMVEETVWKRVRKVKLLPENNRRLRFLSKEECQQLVAVCNSYLKPIVVTALNTGMRKGEILGLQWDKNIDLRHGFILLDMTKNGERREIPINSTLREMLHKLPRRIDSPYVFTDETGNRFQDIKKGFGAACRRAGIKDFHFHDLRHTFASHLVMAGVDLTTVKELLGHKTLTMTLRYAHLSPTHKVNAVQLLDSTLSEKPTLQKLDSETKKGLAFVANP